MEWVAAIISAGALVFAAIAAVSAWVQAKVAVQARVDAQKDAREAKDQADRALLASETSAASASRSAAALELANADNRRRFQTLLDQATDELVFALSGLITVDISTEAIGPHLERLRNAALTVVDRMEGDPQVVSAWFEAERAYGIWQGWTCQRRVDRIKHIDQVSVKDLIDAQTPLHEWARDFLQNVRLWRVGGAADDELKDQTDRLIKATKPSSEWA